jgi:hypothetical protein
MAKRPRLLTAEAKEDRRQRILASKRAWADRNRDYVRAKNREIAMLPQNVAKRKERYFQAKLFALARVGERPGSRARTAPDETRNLQAQEGRVGESERAP